MNDIDVRRILQIFQQNDLDLEKSGVLFEYLKTEYLSKYGWVEYENGFKGLDGVIRSFSEALSIQSGNYEKIESYIDILTENTSSWSLIP